MSTLTILQQVHVELSAPDTLPRSPSTRSRDAPRRLSIASRQPVDMSIDEALRRPHAGQRVFDVAPRNIVGKKRRVAVTVLIILANLMQMISNMVGVMGGIYISEMLGVKGVHATWIAASYPLTQGTFVLMAGRLGAVYGHKNVLLAGGIWFSFLTLANGFITNFLAFNAVRALSGIGGALILPNGVAMLSITNPPGRARNLSLGFFSASAPIGGYLGALIIGLFIEYSQVKWCFVFLALSSVVVFLPLWALLPREVPVDKGGKIDWFGAALGTSALIIFNFVWNQAPAVGWSTPYEIGLLLTSLALFTLFLLWEAQTPHPIMPLSIYKATSFGPLLLVVLLNYMANCTTLWYMLSWLQTLRHFSVLDSALQWTPFLIFGSVAAVFAAWLIPRLAAQWILAIGTVTIGLANLLIATMPVHQTYWAQVFPATILSSFCPDLIYTAAQIIASNAVRRSQQGVAASLIGTLNLYGNSLGLGFAATIETEIGKGKGTVWGYRAACSFGVGISLVALVVDLLFVRMAKDEREGWEHGDEGDEDTAHATGALGTTVNGTEGMELESLEHRP